MKWKVNEKKTQPHWLVLDSIDDFDWPKYNVVAKWDGCVDFREFRGDMGGGEQYIHICELDDFIERLIQLRDEAKKHFGAKWPEE